MEDSTSTPMTAKKRVPKNLEIAMIDYDENPDAPRGAARNTETRLGLGESGPNFLGSFR